MNNNIQELYEKYYQEIYKFFSRKAGENDAEDLTQQTFVKLLTWVGCIDKIRSPKAFIFKIAKNILNDHFKKKKSLSQLISYDDLYDYTDSYDFIKELESTDLLKSLSEDEQRIARLKTEGYTSNEIGNALGISGSTVRTHLQNIRKKLK